MYLEQDKCFSIVFCKTCGEVVRSKDYGHANHFKLFIGVPYSELIAKGWTPPKDQNGNTDGTSAFKNQVGGDHYQKMKITPFDYAMANNLNALEFSVVKYLRRKGGSEQRLEDLRKLIDCAEKLLEWEKDNGKV